MTEQEIVEISEIEPSNIEKGEILENALWVILQQYIANKYMIRVTWHLGRQHGVRDTIRHLTTDGHIIDLQWLRPVNHDSGSHKPDFLISNDSEVQVAIEAKNWAPIPELPRITQEILTRYVAFRNVPYKILVITTPIPSDAKSLLTAENIVIVLVYPQILSNGDLPQIAKIKSALLGQLP